MNLNKLPFFSVLLVACSLRADPSLITLETRTDVSQRILLLESPQPIANVILFAGGHGRLELQMIDDSIKINWGKNNFLVRTRELFLQNGFTVTVIDAPSDMQDATGMLGGFRTSEKHIEDIDRVIDFLRNRNQKTVWLIGTSRGTESVAYAAIHSRQSPNGIILSSSITEENNNGIPVTDLDLEKITSPVLIVAHADDQCWVTPASGASIIESKLTHAKTVDVRYFEGGKKAISRPCKALSEHGFYGLEEKVVDSITEFIRENI